MRRTNAAPQELADAMRNDPIVAAVMHVYERGEATLTTALIACVIEMDRRQRLMSKQLQRAVELHPGPVSDITGNNL